MLRTPRKASETRLRSRSLKHPSSTPNAPKHRPRLSVSFRLLNRGNFMSKGWRTMTASEATELTLVAQRTAIDEPQTVAAATEYPPWIGVDLDGTIAEAMHPFVPYTIGPPILAMVEK